MPAVPLSLVPATLAHAEALLAFELESRAFFEQWIASRGDAFYALEHVVSHLAAAEADRVADRSYAYLAYANQALIGRVNLRGIERQQFHRAMLGYRIGEPHIGQGYATEAVRLALAQAFGTLGLWRVEAVVPDGNPGSHRVLERNHFHRYGRSTRSVQYEGEWHDLHHYERHRDHSL
ncbi:MAG: GNAT family protein [Rhodothermales bacterium]